MPGVESIQYDLGGDLTLRSSCLLDPDTDEDRILPAGTFNPLVTESTTTFKDVQRDLFSQDYFSGSIDNHVHYAVVNNEVANSNLTLLNLAWAGKFQANGTKLSIAELVAENPSRRFLVYDNLGYGGSDALPKNAQKELAATGRFDVYASIVFRALSSVIEDYDTLDIIGESEGGITGTEMIGHIGEVRSLVVFDPPSITRKVSSLFNAFAVKEKAHGQRYASCIQDGIEATEDLSWRELAPSVIKDIVSGRIKIQYIEAKAMSRGSYGEVLPEALPNISDSYTFLSPQFSELNEPDFVRSMIITAIKKATSSPREVKQTIFNGTHAFGTGNPRALPVLESYALNRSD